MADENETQKRNSHRKSGSGEERPAHSTKERAARAYSRAVMEAKYSPRSHGDSEDTDKFPRYSAARRNTPSGVRNSSYSRKAGTAATKRSPARKIAAVAIAVIALVAVVGAVAHTFVTGGIAPGTADNDIVGVNGTTEAQAKLPTPIMAKSKGVYLHCAVSMDDLTEILIHNASYDYACPITTKLTEATNVDVMKAHTTGRDKAAQPTGDEWMTGQFIRTFRSTNAGPRMSAIDCGAAAGSQVYAPVSGTVVLVKQYKLYKKYDDYIVHIQPEGKPNLDVCMIHLTDPTVQAGDQVTAGVTPVAKVRDVYALIGDQMQLKEYTVEGDNGNHTHIQVNNAKAKDYHGLDDLKESASASSSGSAVSE